MECQEKWLNSLKFYRNKLILTLESETINFSSHEELITAENTEFTELLNTVQLPL